MPPRWPRSVKPDVFCFCTLPNLRSEMIRIGVESGAKLIAFEKPVALTGGEGLKVKELLAGSPAKAVVSHQHRYGKHYQEVKEIDRQRRARPGAHRLRHRPRLG